MKSSRRKGCILFCVPAFSLVRTKENEGKLLLTYIIIQFFKNNEEQERVNIGSINIIYSDIPDLNLEYATCAVKRGEAFSFRLVEAD